MHTLRPLSARGFGPKRTALLDNTGTVRRDGAGRIQYKAFAGARSELGDLRRTWGEVANKHLAMAGVDVTVDMRSFAARGIEFSPTTHHGPSVSALKRTGRYSVVAEGLDAEDADRVRQIEATPRVLLDIITDEQSTFTERDMAKVLHRYVDDARTFARILPEVMASAGVVTLRPEIRDPQTGATLAGAVYSTRAMVELEHAMVATSMRLAGVGGFGVERHVVENAIAAVEGKNQARPFVFAQEQRLAVSSSHFDRASIGYPSGGGITGRGR